MSHPEFGTVGEREILPHLRASTSHRPYYGYAAAWQASSSIVFPLPKRCADIRRGGVGEHGGGKRRHSSTARRARRVEEWRRLPPPCQA
ncbi:MAG TPA: hypothetical protein VK140_15135, partial [Ktedonobacteraceae bacterium]|nr:hypothetical protein [Ktedonobacteraceae bacterium]